MTDQRTEQGLDLPSPASPSHLDEKILRYARKRAPERRSYLQPVWLKSMAAVSVVVVAVLLVYPQQLDQVTRPIEIEEIVVSESELLDDAPASAAAAILAPDRSADFDVNRATARKSMQAMESSSEQRMRATVSPQHEAKKEVDSDMLLAGTAAPLPPMDEQTIRDMLADIEELLNAGKTEQAEKNWLALQNRCTGCALPETLEEAIELYLPDNEQ
jgi:hypothetical protein